MKKLIEINSKKIEIRELSLLESINLSRLKKETPQFAFLELMLEKISNVDVGAVSLQDAILILLYYRVFFFENEALGTYKYTGSDKKINITNIHCLDAMRDCKINHVEMLINEEYFKTEILLADCLKAEFEATKDRKINLINLYIIASSCSSGFYKGKQSIIVNSKYNYNFINELINYNQALSKVHNIGLDLIESYSKINIETTVYLNEKEGSCRMVIPFLFSKVLKVELRKSD